MVFNKNTTTSILIYNCFRCSECYHSDTFQRAKHIIEIPDSQISSLSFNKTELHITCKYISAFSISITLRYDNFFFLSTEVVHISKHMLNVNQNLMMVWQVYANIKYRYAKVLVRLACTYKRLF